ncbi:MAG: hypothetical protein DLM71_00610 [Chloroflexi bacterium]|nr:MAG: hypothetical protein DLM71_00610 [Chloroflexota bacterium]
MITHHPSSPRHFGLRGLSPFGPDRLATALAHALDDRYHYVRHVLTPGAAPIDAVLVGPSGTWTFIHGRETGRFRRRNGHWYRWNPTTDSWIPWEAREVTAARLAGHRLELLLDRAALPAAVRACLCPARGADVSWEPDQRPGIDAPSSDALERFAATIDGDEVLAQAQVDRIVALLDPRQPVVRLATSPGR